MRRPVPAAIVASPRARLPRAVRSSLRSRESQYVVLIPAFLVRAARHAARTGLRGRTGSPSRCWRRGTLAALGLGPVTNPRLLLGRRQPSRRPGNGALGRDRSVPARNRRRRRSRPGRARGPRRCTWSARRSPSPCSRASTRWLCSIAAGLYASNGAGRFQERYLFSILPLIPLGFGLFLRHGRPARVAVLVICAVLVLVGMRVPALGVRSEHRLERLAVALGGGEAEQPRQPRHELVARGRVRGDRRRARCAWSRSASEHASAFGATIVFLVAASVGATSADLANVRVSRAQFVSANPTWVDDASVGNVTAVADAARHPGPADGAAVLEPLDRRARWSWPAPSRPTRSRRRR